jgi:hypothetical protein
MDSLKREPERSQSYSELVARIKAGLATRRIRGEIYEVSKSETQLSVAQIVEDLAIGQMYPPQDDYSVNPGYTAWVHTHNWDAD